MKTPSSDVWFLALSLFLAAFFWYTIFLLRPLNFWAEMAGATLILGGLAAHKVRTTLGLARLWTLRAWVIGITSVLCLYSLFWLGDSLSQWLFPVSSTEISAVYFYRDEASPWVILLLLLFAIGPCEEIFWRAYVQSSLSRFFGRNTGFATASILYGLVHVWAENLMLLLAALTCGFFWGWLYRKQGELAPVIISHALWDALIFVILPLR